MYQILRRWSSIRPISSNLVCVGGGRVCQTLKGLEKKFALNGGKKKNPRREKLQN